MSIAIANLNPTVDTFQSWLTKTNQIADALSTVVLTTAANTIGGQNSSNAYINGTLSANIFAVTQELRGGTVAVAANLLISSNTSFTGANVAMNTTYLNLTSTSTTITGGTLVVGGTTTNVSSNNFYVKGTSIAVTANGRVGINTSSADAALTVAGAANVTGAVYVGGNVTISSVGAVATGKINFGNTATRSLSYDGTKFMFGDANVAVNGHITANGIITVGNTGIDGVDVAAFKAAYNSRNLLKVYDVSGTLLFTM
jgi:hypothetical protein